MGTAWDTRFDWTDEKAIATLKRMWGEGASASEIAKALGGGVSRNSVIGKCHRLGLRRMESGKSAGEQPKKVNPASAPRQIAQATAETQAASRVGIAGNGATFEHAPAARLPVLREVGSTGTPARIIDDHFSRLGCKWPITDPGAGQMDQALFCNGPRAPGEARYCCAHLKIAVNAKQPKRKTNPPPLGGGQGYRYGERRFAW